MLQYLLHDGVLVCQLLQHFFRGDILACLGFLRLLNQLHFAKQYFAHLFGRRYVERLARQRVYLLFNVVKASVEGGRYVGQRFGVEAHAIQLHLCQYGHQGHVDVGKHVFGLGAVELGGEVLGQKQRHIGRWC